MGLKKAAKKISKGLLYDWYAKPTAYAYRLGKRKYKEGAFGRYGSRVFSIGKYALGEAKGYAKAAAKYTLAAGAAVGYGTYLTARFAKNVAVAAGHMSETGARAIKSVASGGVEVAKKEEEVVARALGDVAEGGEKVVRAVGEVGKQVTIGGLEVAQQVERTAAVGLAAGVKATETAALTTGEPAFQPGFEIPSQDNANLDTEQPDDTKEDTSADSLPQLPNLKLMWQKPLLVPI